MLIAIAGVAGCAVNGQPDAAAGGGAPQTSEVSASTDVTDEETCLRFSDVMTIVNNAEVGVFEGRMEKQEQEGWHRLATRVIDRTPSTGTGDVSDALAAVKSAVPPVARGAYGPPMIGTDEWRDAMNALINACNESGNEFAVEMFTGG